MGTLSLNLPLPVNNGAGAGVDCSTLGAPRTITCQGELAGAVVAIEVSTDAGVSYTPLHAFNGPTEIVIPVAAQYMRTNVSGRGSKPWLTFSVNVDVGAPDSGSTFGALAMPVLNGGGAALDVSAFENFCSFVCTGVFAGCSIAIQISEEAVPGASDWSTVAAFYGKGGVVNRVVSAHWMRAFVTGRVSGDPFTAVLGVGNTDLGGGGGGAAAVVTDASLSGDGSGGDPLALVVGGINGLDTVVGSVRPTVQTILFDDCIASAGLNFVSAGTGQAGIDGDLFYGNSADVCGVAGLFSPADAGNTLVVEAKCGNSRAPLVLANLDTAVFQARMQVISGTTPPTALNAYDIAMGWMGNSATNDGAAFFMVSPDILGNGNWWARCRVPGGTDIDTGVAVDGNFHVFGIHWNLLTSTFLFYIDGVLVATNPVTPPAGSFGDQYNPYRGCLVSDASNPTVCVVAFDWLYFRGDLAR